jgi:hypothetical protein
MSSTAEKTDPQLWDQVKQDVTDGDKGGKPGQWSARKAQYAVQEYKKRGGGYEGRKSADNPLRDWAREDWGTESGKPSGEAGESGICPSGPVSRLAMKSTRAPPTRSAPIPDAASSIPGRQAMSLARPAVSVSLR